MDVLTRLFRRETVSTEFIPVVDGLRFLAILMVVLHHADGYIREKSNSLDLALDPSVTPNIFVFGHQGVQLFFVISGFVLALPFMRFYLGLSPTLPSIKTYFLRRLTRLEPPYIISLILLFLLIVFVAGSTHSPGTLIASFFASLFYVHNFVFPGVAPFINHVTWSLEVEVQYYILAPALIWLICRFRSRSGRRIFSLTLIILFAVLSWAMEVHWQVRMTSLLLFLHYFLAGVLLCDIFLDDRETLRTLDRRLIFLVGVALLVILTCTEHSLASTLWLRIASPLMILGFFLIVFGNSWWTRIFSLNLLTLIGGMCYSIYLLHPAVISGTGRFLVSRWPIRESLAFYWLQLTVLSLLILIVSATYFILIEKPCMKRDWYLKPIAKVRSFFRVDETTLQLNDQ